MKNLLKVVLKYGIIYISIIALFLILLTAVSLIPSSKIKENVSTSAEILSEQKNKYLVRVRNWNLMFDNYTDALMINTAYSIDSKDAFYSCMVARKNYIPGKTTIIVPDLIGGVGFASKYEELDQIRRITRYYKRRNKRVF